MFDVAILDTPALLASSLAQGGAPAPGGVDVTRYLLACLIVIGLLCVGAWFLARLGKGGMGARGRKRSLAVVDVLALGRKQKLCVVRAYDRTFVLGLGEREVSVVAELDGEDDLAAQALLEDGEASAKQGRSFASMVRGALGGASSIADAARGARVAAQAPAAQAPAAQAPSAFPEPTVAQAPAAATESSIERRAADAAREALMAILDERRDAQAPRRTRSNDSRDAAQPATQPRAAKSAAPQRRAAANQAAPEQPQRRTARRSADAAAPKRRATKPAAAARDEDGEAPRRRVTRPLGERGARPSAEFGSGPSNEAPRRAATAATERRDDGASTWVG